MADKGTVTVTEERLTNIHKIVFAWTSDTGGDAGLATKTTTYQYTGAILGLVTIPGTGADQPDDNYNVTLLDDSGVDVLNAQGLLRDDTNTEWVLSSLGFVANDQLTLSIDSAGDTLQGTVIVYVGLTPGLDTMYTDMVNAIYGASGIGAFPAAAAAANGVSLAEVLRYIQESQIGTLANTGGTATLGDILGDVAAVDVTTRLAALAGYAVAMERAIEKSDGAVLNGADDLFTIAGGPILVTAFVGIVTTQIGANAATCQIQITTTAPAGTVNLSTAVNIEGDAVGTSYTFTAATPGVLTPTTAGAIDQFPANGWLCPIGTLKANCSAANTGNIKWYMHYKPLSAASVVAAAA